MNPITIQESVMPSCASQRPVAYRLRLGPLLLGLGLLLPGAIQAQRPIPPPHFAIQNARIVTVSGQTIDRGTIVIENGLITAVGSNAQVPAGAWVIDGEGLTVYPGLVDAMSSVGLPASMRVAGGGRGTGQAGQEQAPYSLGPEDRPATFTWMSAADDLNLEDDAIVKWRDAGFTSVMVSPERGLFPGQAAFINLAGDRGRDMVVKTPVAMRVNLQAGRGFRGYPNSLFGAIAYVRQSFIDAAHYEQAWNIYNASPAGLERPEYDRAIEPLRDVLNNGEFVMLPGEWAYEVQRMVKFGNELGINTLIYGVHQGYQIADELAEQNIPVLLNANWPERAKDGDPDADVALRVLRFRDRAPTTPAAFEQAGVQFAFYAGGAEPDKLMANVRKSIALGLSQEAAVRAFTLGPAELFGVADRVGSLEEGKIANITVTDGDLFAKDTKVKMVFVDGKRFEVDGAAATMARGGEEEEEGEEGEAEEEGEEEEEVLPPVPMVQDRGPINPSNVTLIQNATILTVSQGTIENGSILIRDGKIAAVGTDIEAPGNATVIDASGKYVMPGIIDEHSHTAADAINEGSIAVSSMVDINDVINPDDIAIYRAVAGGVTSASILHGSANPIGGLKAMIKMRWGEDADGLLLEGAPKGIKMALGENVKRDRDPDRYPGTRMGVMDVIRQALLDAQEYQAEWDTYNALSDRERRNVIPPRRDLKLEAIAGTLDGSTLVHVHTYRADETLQMLRVAEEFGIKIATLIHVLEGYKVADEIAAHGAGGSTFSDWWSYKMEAYDAIPYNAALMTERGVLTCINSDSDEEMRHLNQEAAKAMKWGGMSEEDALRQITLNPAIMLGIEDRVGSIDVGKDADLVIYNNHPLSAYSIVEKTIIDGLVYFDREHDRALRQQLEQEKQALLDKEKGKQDKPRVTTDAEDQEVQR
jgi:imidazolonepropionase-like amidohydrolase